MHKTKVRRELICSKAETSMEEDLKNASTPQDQIICMERMQKWTTMSLKLTKEKS